MKPRYYVAIGFFLIFAVVLPLTTSEIPLALGFVLGLFLFGFSLFIAHMLDGIDASDKAKADWKKEVLDTVIQIKKGVEEIKGKLDKNH